MQPTLFTKGYKSKFTYFMRTIDSLEDCVDPIQEAIDDLLLPYILLNEIQTMFSQLAKRSARVLPADLCTDHAHYVKINRSTVLRRNKNMAVEGGTVSHYCILVIREFLYFMPFFRHSVWFCFSVKQ